MRRGADEKGGARGTGHAARGTRHRAHRAWPEVATDVIRMPGGAVACPVYRVPLLLDNAAQQP